MTRVWLRENGLPQNTVTAVLQTHDGYLWIGSYNGLARFDGARFVAYDSGNTPELVDSRVTSLFEDRDGVLWIGHETGELTRYANGRFSRVAEVAHQARKKILDLGADEAGDLWLFYEDGLLARLRDGLLLKPESGTEANVVEMTRSTHGTIWVGRAGRVSVLQNGVAVPLVFDEAASNTIVSSIGASRDGGVWLNADGSLRKWKDSKWVEERVTLPDKSPLLRLVECRNGILVGATSDRGLVFITPDGKVSSFNRTNGFYSDWAVALCEDRENNLWVGTGGNGLAMLRESIVQTVAPLDAWQGRATLSVCCDRQNALWIGTEGAGLYRFQDGNWTNFAYGAGLANTYIWSLAEDTEGRLWAGTWGAGLYLWNSGRFETPPAVAGITTPMPAMLPSRQGGLWIGTAEGLLRYDAAGKISWYDKSEIPAKRDVRCVLETKAGSVWFGTAGEGLFCLDGSNVKQFRTTNGLPGDFVRCLREDETGAIWIGTSDGLCRFKNNRFAALNTRQGLFDNVVCDIEDDGHGFFWISSFNGIFRVSEIELQQCADGTLGAVHCQAFGIADGLPTLEATGVGCKTADGRLWFPTGRGLVVIDPVDEKTNRRPPPVKIEGLLVDNQPVTGLDATSPVKISPGRHRFHFQYTALSLAAPEKVRFRHRLDGLDTEWNDAGSERAADFPYIPPGDYTFHVIACNNDGVWNEDGATFAFTVLPHFWQTTWFDVTGGLLTVLVASAAVWFDTRRRMRRKVELLERQQAVERERTRIAKDIHDDLGASLTRINLLSQTARRDMTDPPQTVKNLDQICTTARQLTRALDEIVWAVDPQHDTLDSLASYLGKLIHEVMSDSGVRCRLDFPMDLPSWPVTAEARHNLFLALKEALNNVLKHAAATEVRIAFALEPAAITVTVTDNGRGFDPVILADASGNRLRLNGLLNMRKRLQEIGGRCEIQAQPGQGTTVKFFLPAKEMVW